MYGVLDIGTTKIKIFVYDEELSLRYRETVDNITSPDGTQNPGLIAASIKHFLNAAREQGVRKFGVATYRASVVAWDQGGRPLTPIYTWLFGKVDDLYGRWFAALQHLPKLGILFRRYSPLFKFLRAYKDGGLGGCLKAGTCFLWTLDGFVAYLLSRRYISDATNAALSGFIHPRSFKPIPLVKELIGVELPLPEVVDNYGEFGDVEGMEFRVLIADQQAAAVAEGATNRGVVKVTLGTGLFVDMPTVQYAERRGLVPLVLYRVGRDTRYGLEAYLPAAGHFIEGLVSLGLATYEELSGLDPGGEYLYVLPAPAGLQYPPAAWVRGALMGLRLYTRREELLSSVVATLSFYVKYVLEAGGYKAKRVRVDGGGSRLGSFLRCLASVVDAPVERPEDYEGTARGVLSLLAYGDGLVELGKPLGRFTQISGKSLYCKRNFETWLRKMKFLKNLKPFFQAV